MAILDDQWVARKEQVSAQFSSLGMNNWAKWSLEEATNIDRQQSREDAVAYLQEWLTWLEKATKLQPELNQLREMFGTETLDLDKKGIQGEGFLVSWEQETMRGLIRDQSLSENVAHRTLALFGRFQQLLAPHGIFLQEDPEYHDLAECRYTFWIDGKSRNPKWGVFTRYFGVMPTYIGKQIDFRRKETIYCWDYEELDKESDSCVGHQYPLDSVKLLLLLQYLVKKAETFKS